MYLSRALLRIREERYVILLSLLYASLIFALSPINLPIEDSAIFSDIGRHILDNGSYPDSTRSPGFPALIAFYMWIFGDGFMKPMLASISFLLIISVFFFTREMTGNRRTSYITSILFALSPLIFYNSMKLLSDIAFTLLVIISFTFYLKFQKDRDFRYLLLCSVIAGLSVYFRYLGVLVVVICLADSLWRKKRHLKLKEVLCFLVIFVIVLSPWALWRLESGLSKEAGVADVWSQSYGELVYQCSGGHCQLNMEVFQDGVSANRYPIELPVPVLFEDGSLKMGVPPQLVNISRILGTFFMLLTPLVFIAFFWSVFRYRRKILDILLLKSKSRNSLLFWWILIFTGFYSIYPIYFGARYIIPIVLPVIIVFTGWIISVSRKKNMLLYTIVALQIVISLSVIYVDSQTRWAPLQTDIFYDSGTWLKKNTPEDSVVGFLGAPGPAITYYGEREVINCGEGDCDTYPPDYIVESDFLSVMASLPTLTIKDFEFENELKAEFSDDKYSVKIYEIY